MEVKGYQRSNMVNYALWLSYLVKRITEPLNQIGDNHVLNRGQMKQSMFYDYNSWSAALPNY